MHPGGAAILYNPRLSEWSNMVNNPPAILTPITYYGDMRTFRQRGGVLSPSNTQGFNINNKTPDNYNVTPICVYPAAVRIIMSAMAPSVPEINTNAGDKEGSGSFGLRIRCPRCGWRPGRNDKWSCTCGCVWNTFETGGVCPECLHQWTSTQCLSCRRWSPHSDWYLEE